MMRVATRLVSSDAVRRRRGAADSATASWATWRLPVALVALGLIPVLAGSARLAELAGGPELLPPRFDPSPVPLVVHIVSVIIFAVLGAFQFSVGRGRPRSGGTTPQATSSWLSAWSWRSRRCG